MFAGGWTLESAEAVADPAELGLDTLDALTSLADQSLVTADSAVGIAQVLQALTFMASWEGRHTDAVRPAVAAEPVRERLGGRVPLDFLGSFVGDPEGSSRAHLPNEVADRAFAEGRALSVDDAMALATGAT